MKNNTRSKIEKIMGIQNHSGEYFDYVEYSGDQIKPLVDDLESLIKDEVNRAVREKLCKFIQFQMVVGKDNDSYRRCDICGFLFDDGCKCHENSKGVINLYKSIKDSKEGS